MAKEAPLQSGYHHRAMPSEQLCGDMGQFWALQDGSALAALSDGLGHGRLAFEASEACIKAVGQDPEASLQDIMVRCNEALRGSRGVALSLVKFLLAEARLECMGIGNVEMCLIADNKVTRMVNGNGILGYEPYIDLMQQVHPFSGEGERLFMTTDGVNSKIDLSTYRPEYYGNLDDLARAIVVDHGLSTDDASALIVS